jgi:hypothetical protein
MKELLKKHKRLYINKKALIQFRTSNNYKSIDKVYFITSNIEWVDYLRISLIMEWLKAYLNTLATL